jgi:hypothetical protein
MKSCELGRRDRTWVFLLGTLLGGCVDPLDVVGTDEIVHESRKEEVLKDDQLSDKKPQYDAERTVEEEFDGCKVTLNKSASVTRLTLQSPGRLRDRIFPSRVAARAALEGAPTLPTTEVVNGALKPFNDGLYAAVELAAEHGEKSAVNKHRLLLDLLAELVKRSEAGAAEEREPALAAANHVAAALMVGAAGDQVPEALRKDAARAAQDFEQVGIYSKPIGFYTWSAELETIFKRDRFLQTRHRQAVSYQPSFAALAALGLVVGQPGELSSAYRRTLDLYAGITDPFFDASPFDIAPFVPNASALGDLPSVERSFAETQPVLYPDSPFCNPAAAAFPASESADNRIMRALLCGGELEQGETMIDGLIRKIQSGEVDLAPRENSGFYDMQLHALQTLLVPDQATESQHLLLTRAYKEKLVETFKSLLVQTRETHVKQVGLVDSRDASAVSVPIEYTVYPKLVVEPFPTFYLRTARAYRFLERVLEAALGTEFLDGTARLIEDGSRAELMLRAELHQKQQLLYGLHALAADSIGMASEPTADEQAAFPLDEARHAARAWLANVANDADIARDPRVSLPVAFETIDSVDYAIYWAVVGVKVLRLHASYPETHRPEVVSASPGCVQKGWAPFEPHLLVEQTIQVHRRLDKPPLTRDEFRALCDQHDTVDAIVEAFAAAP